MAPWEPGLWCWLGRSFGFGKPLCWGLTWKWGDPGELQPKFCAWDPKKGSVVVLDGSGQAVNQIPLLERPKKVTNGCAGWQQPHLKSDPAVPYLLLGVCGFLYRLPRLSTCF